MKKIEIVVWNGVVDSVEGIPEGYEVDIKDYDDNITEEPDGVKIKVDAEGDLYWHSIYQ